MKPKISFLFISVLVVTGCVVHHGLETGESFTDSAIAVKEHPTSNIKLADMAMIDPIAPLVGAIDSNKQIMDAYKPGYDGKFNANIVGAVLSTLSGDSGFFLTSLFSSSGCDSCKFINDYAQINRKALSYPSTSFTKTFTGDLQIVVRQSTGELEQEMISEGCMQIPRNLKNTTIRIVSNGGDYFLGHYACKIPEAALSEPQLAHKGDMYQAHNFMFSEDGKTRTFYKFFIVHRLAPNSNLFVVSLIDSCNIMLLRNNQPPKELLSFCKLTDGKGTALISRGWTRVDSDFKNPISNISEIHIFNSNLDVRFDNPYKPN